MRKAMAILLILLPAILLCACGQKKDPETAPATEKAASEITSEEETKMEKKLVMSINGTGINVQWEDNESVSALKDSVREAPLTIAMSMYGGFEQVGPLGMDLPRTDVQMTTDPGDIVLYSGDQIVVFYGSNSWAYTKLGRMTDLLAEELEDLLGNHDITITLEMQ